MRELWGAGVYALSEEGRARFSAFPDVVADDLFVASCFRDDEIEIVDCAPATVTTPRRARDLKRILARAQRGKRECMHQPSVLRRPTTVATVRDLARAGVRTPMDAIEATTYVAVALASRFGVNHADAVQWERDESSRWG
jgi:hypothetical protein